MAAPIPAASLPSKRRFGIAASLEGGYPLRLGPWVIEPQLQLVYQRVALDDAADVAASVRFPAADSLVGRAGVRVARSWAFDETPRPRRVTGWLTASLLREFLGNAETEVSSAAGFVSFRSNTRGNWADLGGGLTAQLTPSVALYASASYFVGFDGDRHGYGARGGVRLNW